MYRDWFPGLESRLEFPAFEHLGDVVLRRKPYPSIAAERLEPFVVETNLGLLRIEDLEDLRFVRVGVRVNFLARQRGTRFRSAGRIADQRGERAHHINDRVSQILKVLHLSDEHRVPEVKVRR